jgi:hypothetical protein
MRLDNNEYEEVHNLYFLPSTISMIKPRRIRWARLAACVGEKNNA